MSPLDDKTVMLPPKSFPVEIDALELIVTSLSPSILMEPEFFVEPARIVPVIAILAPSNARSGALEFVPP